MHQWHVDEVLAREPHPQFIRTKNITDYDDLVRIQQSRELHRDGPTVRGCFCETRRLYSRYHSAVFKTQLLALERG